MTIEAANSEAFLEAEAQAQARGQRVIALKRGRTNASWTIELSEPPEPELGEAYPHPVLRRLPFDFQEGLPETAAISP